MAVYHNIPMDPVVGRAAIRDFIAGFTTGFDGIDFQVHRQVSDGELVINERTDVMRRQRRRGNTATRVRGLRSRRRSDRAWRDYFDLATVTKAFS